jgi:hypothetical protein
VKSTIQQEFISVNNPELISASAKVIKKALNSPAHIFNGEMADSLIPYFIACTLPPL